METKYLSDGRKVAVIDTINKQEFIVQEIFIAGDTEAVGGEKFTAKKLLDQPPESWQARKAREEDARYALAQSRLEGISREIDTANALLRSHKALAESAKRFLTGVKEGALIDIIDLCSGKIEYIVREHEYSIYRPIKTIDMLKQNDRYDSDSSLRLLSLLGKTGKRPELAVAQYSDGSGNSWSPVSFHRTKKSAVARLKEQALAIINDDKKRNGSITLDEFAMCIEEGVIFPAAIKQKCIDQFRGAIAECHQKNLKHLHESNAKADASYKQSLQRIEALSAPAKK